MNQWRARRKNRTGQHTAATVGLPEDFDVRDIITRMEQLTRQLSREIGALSSATERADEQNTAAEALALPYTRGVEGRATDNGEQSG